MTSVIIHGHFYQPPRENPWTGAIDREDSAQPARAILNVALDLIALSRQLNLRPNLDKAQEKIYDAFLHGVAHAGQLVRLAGAVGISHSAIKRQHHHQVRRRHSAMRRDRNAREKPVPARGSTDRS